MKIPGNISYFLKRKENNLLPGVFNKYLLNISVNKGTTVKVEGYIESLRHSDKIIAVEDFGAGSKIIKTSERKVSSIVKTSATKYKYGLLYQKLVDYYNINSVLELGTSLGVGTMFFALASHNVHVTTIEACNNIYEFTKKQFDDRGIQNVSFINAKFDDVFNNSMLEFKKFDLFFIDGNHKSNKVLEYCKFIEDKLVNDRYIIIIDDINWNCDMYNAWRQLIDLHRDCCVLNLFHIGVVFKGFEYQQDDFIIKFVK